MPCLSKLLLILTLSKVNQAMLLTTYFKVSPHAHPFIHTNVISRPPSEYVNLQKCCVSSQPVGSCYYLPGWAEGYAGSASGDESFIWTQKNSTPVLEDLARHRFGRSMLVCWIAGDGCISCLLIHVSNTTVKYVRLRRKYTTFYMNLLQQTGQWHFLGG